MQTAIDIAAVRRDTPGAYARNHLNNAGAALMPAPVLAAMTAHLELEGEIGGYEACDARAAEIERSYSDIAALVNAKARNVAIVANATQGFVQALSAFDFAPGDVIVTSLCDYVSNQIQYLSLVRRCGVEIVRAADLPEGGVDPQSVHDLLASRPCKLVALTWIPTNSGLVQDVEAVGRACRAFGVPYLVDACQAVGQLPIDVERIGCDYLSVTARKFLRGPRGIGFLYASDEALRRGDYPLYVDMRGARWTDGNAFEVVASAQRFEDWEFPYALVLGQGAAVRYALDIGVEAAGARAAALAASLRARLSAIPGVRVLDRGKLPCAIVTAAIDGRRAEDMVMALRERGINSSASLREYGRFDFEQKRVEDAVRLSPHYYNTEDEIAQAAEAVAELAR